MRDHSEVAGATTWTRRQVLARAAAAGLSAPFVGGLLAACGGGSASDEPTPATGAGGGASTATTGAGTSSSTQEATGSTSSGSEVDKVVVLQGAEVRFFDPTQRFSSTDANPNVNIYETLIRMNAAFELEPLLAVSWESVDETTWQFKLRDGVTFHNGEPFNADTVVAWFERLQTLEDLLPQASSSIDQLPLVHRVEKVDDLTVNFITTAPDPTLIRRLTTYYTLITPSKIFEEEGPDALANKGVGTGPYRFVEWVKDDHVLLEANTDYWGEVPKVKQLEFRPVTEPSSRVASLLAGEAQIVDALPLAAIQQLEANENVEVRSVREATRIYWCQWNATGNEHLKSLQVRQALNYAVDKQAIIDSILGGHAEQNASCVTFESFGYADVPEYEYDPEKAKQLLAEAGYPNGFTITIEAALGRTTGDTEIVQALIDYFRDVGVTLELVQHDFATYLNLLTQQKIQGLTFGGKTLPALDADYMFTELQPDKTFGWLFPLQGEAQELFEQERVELNETRRAELAARIQQWFRDQAGALFLWQADLLYGVSKSLNWQPRGDGLILGAEMSGT